jgi:hypothetical protein
VTDHVTFAIGADGSGFAIIVLYSNRKQYEPRIIWTDAGQVYRVGDGRIEIVRRGRHTKYVGCQDRNANVTLPSTAIDYFNRLPYSLEQSGRKTKPEHRLFWSSNRGLTVNQRTFAAPMTGPGIKASADDGRTDWAG